MNASVFLLTVLAVAAQGFIVRGPSGPLNAVIGGSIVLPCSVEPALPLEDLEIQWFETKYEDKLFGLFQQGEATYFSDDNYSGRYNCSFFTGEIVKGNYSILLSNIRPTNAESYKCVVHFDNQTNEAVMKLEEFGELTIKVIFGMVTGGTGALVAFLTSGLFRRFLCKNGNLRSLHVCHMTVPNVLLFFGSVIGGAGLYEQYSMPSYSRIIISEFIIKHTLSISTIHLMRILLLFKVCPDLATFPDLFRQIATTLSVPVVNLVFGIVTFAGTLYIAKTLGYETFDKNAGTTATIVVNIIPLLALGAQVIHLKKWSEQPQPRSNSGSPFTAVAYTLQTCFLGFFASSSYLFLDTHVHHRGDTLMYVMLKADFTLIFFLSVVCIFKQKSQQPGTFDIFVYEVGASVLPIFNGIFLIVAGYQVSKVQLDHYIMFSPQIHVIIAESVFLSLWACSQTRFFGKNQTHIHVEENDVLLQNEQRELELSPVSEDDDNGSPTEVIAENADVI